MANPGRTITGVTDWQRRFFAAPKVWATFYRDADGVEDIGSLYESAEAAQCEVEWAKRQGRIGRRIPLTRAFNVHTLALARERWGE